MSITSPIPVLQGDRDTELRADGTDLLLRRRDDELRIPLAAIAHVRAERRVVAVELTAPAGVEPVVYRIEDVSAAGATVFADVVNAALPERAEGTETIDGSSLVVTRSLRSAADVDEEAEEDEDLEGPGLFAADPWLRHTLCVAAGLLAVAVGVAGQSWSRGIATLLLGQAGAVVIHVTLMLIMCWWLPWYLPRYGITVDAEQVYRSGTTALAYTDADGVTRHIQGLAQNGTARVAYSPRKPQVAVVSRPLKIAAGELTMFLFMAGIAALLAYGTYRLALPAFGG
ncbi:hypothetical protein AB0C77_12170 [Streptomyces sp. NPDC048629]|uniref:hypothetical protein n=1 Tax=Streptomyces sp. NPDC048629 TaxID=3154824 RepID=UPI00343D1A10